jgi:hypothetical protein
MICIVHETCSGLADPRLASGNLLDCPDVSV